MLRIFCRITYYATSYATLLLHDEHGKSHFDNELSELLAMEEKYILSKVVNDVSFKLDRLKSFHTYKKIDRKITISHIEMSSHRIN